MTGLPKITNFVTAQLKKPVRPLRHTEKFTVLKDTHTIDVFHQKKIIFPNDLIQKTTTRKKKKKKITNFVKDLDLLPRD